MKLNVRVVVGQLSRPARVQPNAQSSLVTFPFLSFLHGAGSLGQTA